MRGHIFCSTQCARDSARAELRLKIQEQLGRAIPGRVAVAVVLAAACAPTVLALRAVSELDRLNQPLLSPIAPRPTLVRIERVVPGADGARIEGRAPDGGAVFLFAGSRFVATAYVEDGQFRFEGVKVDGPYRVGSLALAAEPVTARATPIDFVAPKTAAAEPTALPPQSAPSAAPIAPAAPIAAAAAGDGGRSSASASGAFRSRSRCRRPAGRGRSPRRPGPLSRPQRPAGGARLLRRGIVRSRRPARS